MNKTNNLKSYNSQEIKKDIEQSRLMKNFNYLKDEPNEPEVNWVKRVGKEIIK